MKLKKENLEKAKSIITKINFNSSKVALMFPLDLEIEHINEFGIKSSQYKAESHYGSNLVSGLTPYSYFYSKDDRLTVKTTTAYASGVNLFSFNLEEYMSITQQSELSEEERDFICKYECCICQKEHLFIVTQE